MMRVRTRLILLPLIGFVSTVAVAWSVAAFAYPFHAEHVSSGKTLNMWIDGEIGATVQIWWSDPYRGGGPDEARILAPEWARLGDPLPGRQTIPKRMCIATGWPMAAFASDYRKPVRGESGHDAAFVNWAPINGMRLSDTATWLPPHVLPTRPVWNG